LVPVWYLAVHAAEPVATKTGAMNRSSNGSIDVGVRPPPVKVQVPFDCCSVPRAPPMLPKVTMMLGQRLLDVGGRDIARGARSAVWATCWLGRRGFARCGPDGDRLPLSSDYSISEVADQLGETKWMGIPTGCARVVGKSTQNTRPTDTGIELGSSLRASP
jgi:hypothetical protein